MPCCIGVVHILVAVPAPPDFSPGSVGQSFELVTAYIGDASAWKLLE